MSFTEGPYRMTYGDDGLPVGIPIHWDGTDDDTRPRVAWGRYIWTPARPGEEFDAVRAVVKGDFSDYYVRDPGAFKFEADTRRYFDNDEIKYRRLLSTDGDLIDTDGLIEPDDP